MNDIRWLFHKYMVEEHITDFKELAKLSGIKYQTLLDHLNRPELFRTFEIQRINEILHFSSEDLLKIIE